MAASEGFGCIGSEQCGVGKCAGCVSGECANCYLSLSRADLQSWQRARALVELVPSSHVVYENVQGVFQGSVQAAAYLFLGEVCKRGNESEL